MELLAKHATLRLQNGLERNLRAWQTLKGRQRDESGEEARVMTCVSGQDPSDGGKTGGKAQSQIFELPEDAERIR